jgi:hypothetical protein
MDLAGRCSLSLWDGRSSKDETRPLCALELYFRPTFNDLQDEKRG